MILFNDFNLLSQTQFVQTMNKMQFAFCDLSSDNVILERIRIPTKILTDSVVDDDGG